MPPLPLLEVDPIRMAILDVIVLVVADASDIILLVLDLRSQFGI
jgi:hypothetical protein